MRWIFSLLLLLPGTLSADGGLFPGVPPIPPPDLELWERDRVRWPVFLIVPFAFVVSTMLGPPGVQVVVVGHMDVQVVVAMLVEQHQAARPRRPQQRDNDQRRGQLTNSLPQAGTSPSSSMCRLPHDLLRSTNLRS